MKTTVQIQLDFDFIDIFFHFFTMKQVCIFQSRRNLAADGFPSLRPDDTPVATAKRLPGESEEEERDSSGRLWRTVIIGDQEQRIDMQVIRPYLRVVTHGGQCDSAECA